MSNVRKYKPSDMSESRVWKHFREAWPYHCERQEPGIGSGQPDVPLLDKRGNRGLIELKRPSKLILRPSQWIWHERDQRNKGRSCVVTCDNVKGRIKWRVFAIDVDTHVLIQLGSFIPEPDLTALEMANVVAAHLRLEI